MTTALKPVIFDFSMNRRDLEKVAQPYVWSCCDPWDLPIPFYKDASPSKARFPGGGKYYGMFNPPDTDGPGDIYVAVDVATRPQQERGRVWTFPGHKTDRSVAGITAHEMGHHVWFHKIRRPKRHDLRNIWIDLVVKTEKKITSYEPTYEEAFAEAARLFILNPDLLKNGRPRRYAFFTGDLKLTPLHDLPWADVLQNAPDHIFEAADKFACQES